MKQSSEFYLTRPGFIEGFRVGFVLVPQVGPLLLRGCEDYSTQIFGCFKIRSFQQPQGIGSSHAFYDQREAGRLLNNAPVPEVDGLAAPNYNPLCMIQTELDVLRAVSQRLTSGGVAFMLNGAEDLGVEALLMEVLRSHE